MSTGTRTEAVALGSRALLARVLLGGVGVAGIGYGLYRLLTMPPEHVPAVLVWAVGGVVVHDALLAPLVVGLGVLAAVSAPRWLRAPLAALLVVLGPLTLVALPVLGGFGARADNPTLLDRPYWTGYLAIVAVAVLVTAVGAWRRRS
jgi:hypothetical protein